MKQEYLKAIFIKEGKTRFICTVSLDGQAVECYISSSSKLSKYLPLSGNDVVISRNKSINLRTQFTLEAVKVENVYYYVNFNKVNRLYEDYLYLKKIDRIDVFRECIIKDIVKTDFFVKNYGCVEVKSLLGIHSKIIFPDNSSLRLERQLLGYIELLKANIDVTFSFISMAETITDFEFNKNKRNVNFYFLEAISLGLKIEGCSVAYNGDSFKIVRNLELENNILQYCESFIMK